MESSCYREEPIAQSDHFETQRLSIRKTIISDKDTLTPVLENPDLVDGWGLAGPPDPEEFVNQAVAGWEFPWTYEARFTFTLIDKASDRVVGCEIMQLKPPNAIEGRGLRAEPAIAIARDLYGNGYGYEAMHGLISWSFDDIRFPNDIMIEEVWAASRASNKGSIRLLSKLAAIGMEDLGEQEIPLVNPLPAEGPTIAGRVFRLTRTNYEATRGA
jgi:RimJ/RimL family protein N-acetyltransferase